MFPADALTAAVLKFSPDKRKKVRQAIWEYMMQRGFTLIEAKRYSIEDET